MVGRGPRFIPVSAKRNARGNLIAWVHWVGDLLVGHELVPEEDLISTEFYNDFCLHADIHYTLGGLLSKRGGRLSRLTVNRPAKRGPWTQRELAMWKVLTAHVRQALGVQRRLLDAETRQLASLDALDRLGYGVFFVTCDGIVTHANHLGEQMLAIGDGLRAVGSRLSALRPRESKALHALIDSAARTSAGDLATPGGAMSVHRPSGTRPYIVQVYPLSIRSAPIPGQHSPVVVFVADPEGERLVPERYLQDVFGLTPREASVAALLAAGRSIAETAEELDISTSTARFYLKQVFSKTDTARQGKLVSLVLRLFGEEPTTDGTL